MESKTQFDLLTLKSPNSVKANWSYELKIAEIYKKIQKGTKKYLGCEKKPIGVPEVVFYWIVIKKLFFKSF